MASSPVGGAIQRIENGYVEIQGRDVLLRSDELADADNENAFGEDKVYYRWRLDGSYLVLLCTAETNATEVPGGGAEVLAVFQQGSAEPQDVADVKGDTFCSFGEKPELSIGPDDAFTIVNSHSNSNQGYLDTALFHVHQGRLRRIDSVFTLSVRGLCEKSFEETLPVSPRLAAHPQAQAPR